MISAEATGVLSVCVYQGVTPSSPALVERFKGVKRQGGDFFKRVLKELREAGFISLKKEVIGTHIRTVCWVTDDGIQYLLEMGFPTPVPTEGISSPLSQQSELINTNTIYSYISNTCHETSSVKEERGTSMGYEFFQPTSSEELDKENEKAIMQARYQQEKNLAANADKAAKRLRSRNQISPIGWTSSDMAYEFADRLLQHWHIMPWSVKESKFIGAFANLRRKYGTNGEIELVMLDLFFSSINFESYTDPERVAFLFLSRFGQLAQTVKATSISEDDQALSSEQAVKSQEWLEIDE